MALKASISKVRLSVSDLDRGVYGDFSLSVAQHPSETEARMMLRVAAFALHAHEQLTFGRGISTDDEPDLWLRDLTGEIELWVDLGNPDPDRLRKACGRARQVVLYGYGDRALPVWWDKYADALARFDNLSVFAVSDDERQALEGLFGTNIELQATISEGELWLTDGEATVSVAPGALMRAG